jgi:phosphatidylglycerophosphatase A
MIQPPAWPRLLPSNVVVNFATLGPVGRFSAPGTWGTVAGLAWYIIMYGSAPFLFGLVLSVGVLYVAFAICGEAESRLRKIDPPEVVLDEFAAVPIIYLGLQDILATGEAWIVLLAGFILFRFFDIAKPLGIRGLQRFPGGLGVLLDDVAAAFASCVSLHLLFRLSPILELLRGSAAAPGL